MHRIIFLILFTITALPALGQGIGEIAPPEPPMQFPPNAWGFDLLIGESGFGFGGFYNPDAVDKKAIEKASLRRFIQ